MEKETHNNTELESRKEDLDFLVNKYALQNKSHIF